MRPAPEEGHGFYSFAVTDCYGRARMVFTYRAEAEATAAAVHLRQAMETAATMRMC